MLKFATKRLIQLIPVLIGVSVLVFFGMHLVPGDVAQLMLGERATELDLQRLRHQLGMDKPVYIQYLFFIRGAVQGDFGQSLRTRRPVSWEIAQALPITIELSLLSLLLAVTVGFIVGVLAANRLSLHTAQQSLHGSPRESGELHRRHAVCRGRS